jgi:hypothetical protein
MAGHWRQNDGSGQRGSIARLCQRPRAAFLPRHVAAYTRQTLALRCTDNSLLDSASASESYGRSARWVLLSPSAAAGVLGHAHCPRSTVTPTHDFGFGLCLVTARAEQDGLTRAQPLDAELSQSRSRFKLLAPLLGI